MIPEIDIWRAAQLMLKRYGEKALDEIVARAAGDENGAATWRLITKRRRPARQPDPARPGPLSCRNWVTPARASLRDNPVYCVDDQRTLKLADQNRSFSSLGHTWATSPLAIRPVPGSDPSMAAGATATSETAASRKGW